MHFQGYAQMISHIGDEQSRYLWSTGMSDHPQRPKWGMFQNTFHLFSIFNH